MMKCERCGWPVSLWQRDLFSGICDKCQRTDKLMPGADTQVAVQHALIAHVVELLNKGESLGAVTGMMASHGFDREIISTVTKEAIAQRHKKYPRIPCPECGAAMTPGKATIRPSTAGTVLDVVSALGGGMAPMPEHLYFRRIQGGDPIKIDTSKSCITVSIARRF